ncbi:MAG TPA: DUF1573 domain-containing protein [Gemmatales bacterium]|nr:DUF1573 domain-containing protein [Gemmatales bacterium]
MSPRRCNLLDRQPICLLLGLLGLSFATGCQREAGLNPPPEAVPPALGATAAGSGTSTTTVAVSTTASGLRVEGDGNLGSADFGEERTATFTLRNPTTRALTLSVVRKSCACALVEVEPRTVPPGGSAAVRLRWRPEFQQVETQEDLAVRMWAELAESESGAITRLEAVGQIAPRLMLHLPRGRLDLGRLDLADLQAGRDLVFEVYSKQETVTEPPRLTTSHKSLEPQAVEALPPDRLLALGVKSGWRLTVRARPGLPVGSWLETISIHTSLYPFPLSAPVTGQVETGAVSLTPGFVDLRTAGLSLGRGYRCPPLRLVLRGAAEPTLRIQQVEPGFLQVELKPAGANAWDLIVRLPDGDQARTGLTPEQIDELLTFGFEGGMITLVSDHPQAGTIQVPLSGGRLRP